MNFKLGSLLAILLSSLLTSLFFLVNSIQNKDIVNRVDRNYRERIERSLEQAVNITRNDLLQGNIRSTRNRLYQFISETEVVDLKIQTKEKGFHELKPYVESVGRLIVSIPVYFSDNGELWGGVRFEVDTKEINQLRKSLKRSLWRSSIGLWVVFIIGFALLYFLVFKMATLLGLIMESSFSSKKISKEKSFTYNLWRPLVDALQSKGELFLSSQKEVVELKKQEELFGIARKVAHDIRSPIGAVRAVIDVSNNLNERERKILNSVADSIDEIAESVLYETKKQAIKVCQSSEITVLLNQVVDEKNIVSHKVKFRNELTEVFKVSINLIGLKNIVSNLVNNSLEASAHGQEVDVELRTDDQFVVIIISDTGTGIAPKHIKAILKGEYTSKVQGNGLGLSSSKNLVEAWGGFFVMESKLGEGTKISLGLPVLP